MRLSSNLTEPQVMLANWLNYYEWLYSPDGPKLDAEVIKDPNRVFDEVDKWKRSFESPGKNTKHWGE